ncbi:MAG TPA: ankyrin repeat domain-containing protein, partial [Candidatus Flavonifractor avistercoris]|nr:ankyrin repeat domain-containing protein [Candidatus Flavonifractor avistercoris]
GIYLDVRLIWYGEDGKPVIKTFATGKTLGESSSDMDRMFLISSAITKAFHGEHGAYARFQRLEDGTKAEGVVLHLSPKERRILMDALLEQRIRQEAQMTNTEQLLRRMTGSITAYMDEVGARPLHMSTADRAVLAVRDGELYAFSSLALQVMLPEEYGRLLTAAAGRPGAVGRRMTKLMLGRKAPYPEDVWLDACKRAVDTGDLQRVQMMLDRTMDKVDAPSPSLPGEVLQYAYLQNPAMGSELIRQAAPEQVAAAPSKLLCAAAYARDLPMLTELLRKGLQPGDHAAPLLLPLLTAYDGQRVAHLLKDGLRVRPEDYDAMNVCLREHAPEAAEALLGQGMKLDGYLAWAAERGTMLDNRAREILEELKVQQNQAHSVQQQGSGPVLGGLSL